MIPLATTSIAVLRLPDEVLSEEPYNGNDATDRVEVASNVRAVIGSANGRKIVEGGEQAVWDFDLVCDLTDVFYTDTIRDNTTDAVYTIEWLQIWPGEHIEAGLRRVQGEV